MFYTEYLGVNENISLALAGYDTVTGNMSAATS
jgi:hypothetical protein